MLLGLATEHAALSEAASAAAAAATALALDDLAIKAETLQRTALRFTRVASEPSLERTCGSHAPPATVTPSSPRGTVDDAAVRAAMERVLRDILAVPHELALSRSTTSSSRVH